MTEEYEGDRGGMKEKVKANVWMASTSKVDGEKEGVEGREGNGRTGRKRLSIYVFYREVCWPWVSNEMKGEAQQQMKYNKNKKNKDGCCLEMEVNWLMRRRKISFSFFPEVTLSSDVDPANDSLGFLSQKWEKGRQVQTFFFFSFSWWMVSQPVSTLLELLDSSRIKQFRSSKATSRQRQFFPLRISWLLLLLFPGHAHPASYIQTTLTFSPPFPSLAPLRRRDLKARQSSKKKKSPRSAHTWQPSHS